MNKFDRILQQELTRKQFIVTMLSAFASILGVTAFLGVFTKNVQEKPSGRPGYGKQGYGP